MQPAVLIRLRPRGPWRYGPGNGGQDRVDTLYRSDRLYSAVTLAMRHLGFFEEWLDATARAPRSAVAFSSLFPYQTDTLFVPPPASLWPPPASLVSAPSPVFLSKTRWNAARFVPLTVVEAILSGQNILAEQWIPDPESGCLLRRDRPNSSPFHVVVRSGIAVDRLTSGSVHITSSACVEFAAGSGLWGVAQYSDSGAESAWDRRVRAAFRLLADSGFGGHRTSGWGQAEEPEFQQGAWPAVLMPKLGRTLRNGRQGQNGGAGSPLYWLLSLYSPSSADSIDWGEGDYRLIVRGGVIDSVASRGTEKNALRMVSEGSVLAAQAEPIGMAVDVAPEGFAHPVYRSGIALVFKLPVLTSAAEQVRVETPTDEEALESRPCEEEKPASIAEETSQEIEEPSSEI